MHRQLFVVAVASLSLSLSTMTFASTAMYISAPARLASIDIVVVCDVVVVVVAFDKFKITSERPLH